MSAYEELKEQIAGFVRRFYLSRLMKGVLIFSGLALGLFLLVINAEYFGGFNTVVRTVLFFGLLFSILGLAWFFIIEPVLKLSKISKQMSDQDAAVLIGGLLPEIDDKVLNTLQLAQLDYTSADGEYVRAAIEQRAANLNKVPFIGAIDLNDNWRYLKFVLPVVVVFFLVLLFNPQIISQGTNRIVNYSTEFIAPAPFEFLWTNVVDEIEEGEDLVIEIALKGVDFPEKVFIQSNYGRFAMTKTSKNSFVYIFPKAKKDVQFYLDGGGYKSDNFGVNVFGASQVGDFTVVVKSPSYTGIPNDTLNNPVFFAVPEGATVVFSGRFDNTKQTQFRFVDTSLAFSSESFSFSKRFGVAQKFDIRFVNKFTGSKGELQKQIDVIKDGFPSIEVNEVLDSTQRLIRFFDGFVRDDYGVSRVNFVTERIRNNVSSGPMRIPVPNATLVGGKFYFMFDLAPLGLKAGEELVYYFEVFDNDAVNGAKRAQSTRYVFKVPSVEELDERRQESLDNAKSGISDMMRQLELFQKNLDEFRKANLDKKTEKWKKKDMLDRLLQQQQSLQQQLEQSKQDLEQSMEEKALFDQIDEDLLKKQEMLEMLLDALMDDELKKLLEELQELMDKNNPSDIEEKIKDVELSKEEMNRQMDRSIEMLKRMDVEERLDKLVDKMEQLAEEQEKLSKEMAGDESDKQDELNERWEELVKELQELEEKNNELKRPFELDLEKEQQENVKKDMQKASDQLNQKKDAKANESQKKAADQIRDMQQSLQAQMEQQKQKQAGEDIETLRSILENLMRLSFDQEGLMLAMQGKSPDDPVLGKLNRIQRKLMDDHVVVKDSLVALAKRVPQVSAVIDAELKVIDRNYGDITSLMHDRKMRELGIGQQFVMTSYNNLALMLNEALEQMQQQMQSMMSGSGSCDKPGGKGQPSEGMGNMKDKLKEQLEKMKGEGDKPGEGKKGDKPGDKPGSEGGGSMGLPGMSSKEVAKMAAEQAAMRKMLEKMRQELNKDGKGTGNKLNPLIEELEKQEKDLVNRNERNLVKRQQEILTRLLESEKALDEREYEERREGETAKSVENRNLIKLDEYKRRKEIEIELLRSVTPGLAGYYRQMANAYFNKVVRYE